MAFAPTVPQFFTLLIIFHMDFGSIVSSILVQCLVPAELSACPPTSYLVVPFFGNYPGNTLLYLHSNSYSGPQCS